MGIFKRFFKSKFFVITLTAALLLSIIPGVLCVMGHGSYVRSALQTMAIPFEWCFTKIGDGLGGYAEYFASIEALRAENAELKDKIARFEEDLYNAALLEEENEYLRGYLGLKNLHTDFLFESATVIGRETANYRTIYTLSRGSLHGIEKNMPVVTEDGLVGYVIETGATWCRVVSIIETASAVGACVERSGDLGLVEGVYDLRFEGLCRMIHIDAQADIREGDVIITSGVGSIYPLGLPVGKVISVEPDENTRTLTAVVDPMVDFENISKVMIITNYNIYSE
jgi:rod shape-determining protein MreC